jgi:hypothetical protein
MEKLLTAEEFLLNELNKETPKSIQDVLIEFAKLHVEAALKEAIVSVLPKSDDPSKFVEDKDGVYFKILNSYPLTNIK